MRLPDENQHGFTRPHLMTAPRRIGGHDNIFAKLERDAPYGRGGRITRHARMAWLGAGGALIVGLIGTVAWLVHENANTPQVVLVADAPSAAERGAGASPAVLARAEDAAAAHRAAGQAATIRDEPEPPMVLMPRERAAAAPGAVSKPAPDLRPAIAARPAPAPRALPAPPLKAAAAAAGPRLAPPKPQLAARPGLERTRRTRMAAPTARPETEVDSDVALLSAVLMHSSNQADERSDKPVQP